MKSEVEKVVKYSDPELVQLAAIRHWTRMQQGAFSEKKWYPAPKSENPISSLTEMKQGKQGCCRRFAIVLTGAYLSVGIPARLAHAAPDFRSNSYNHTLCEVWSNSLKKWILVDADFDTFYLIDDLPASLLEFSTAINNKEYSKISFDRAGSLYKPIPTIYKENSNTPSKLIKSFKHIFIGTSNALFDGYNTNFLSLNKINFYHYYSYNIPAYPNFFKYSVIVILVSTTLFIACYSAIFLFHYIAILLSKNHKK